MLTHGIESKHFDRGAGFCDEWYDECTVAARLVAMIVASLLGHEICTFPKEQSMIKGKHRSSHGQALVLAIIINLVPQSIWL